MADGILDHVKAEKVEALKKFKQIHAVKKFSRHILLFCIPAVLFMAAVSRVTPGFGAGFEAVTHSLRVVCLVVIPGIWHLCTNPRFLFLLSNAIIMSLLVKSGLLNPSNGSADLYAEFTKKNETAPKCYVSHAVSGSGVAEENAATAAAVEVNSVSGSRCETFPSQSQAKYGRSKSEIVKSADGTAQQKGRKLRRSESVESSQRASSEETATSNSLIVVSDGNESAMSDEELNKRVEDFIANFNKQMRLQRQESFARHQEMVDRSE
eukprot:Gb_03556 [translate_table: standard]